MREDVAASQAATSGGRKFDGGKIRYDLLPPFALEDVAKVLTYGSIKYEDNNWRVVPDGRRRYISAYMRHMEAVRKGELFDQETGLPHTAHAMCCLMFILELDRVQYDPVAQQYHQTIINRFSEQT